MAMTRFTSLAVRWSIVDLVMVARHSEQGAGADDTGPVPPGGARPPGELVLIRRREGSEDPLTAGASAPGSRPAPGGARPAVTPSPLPTETLPEARCERHLLMLNEPALKGLIEESQDLHSDAMREVKPALAGLTELHHEAPSEPLDPATIDRINGERQTSARRTGAALAGAGLLSTGIGASLVGLLATPASADEAMDIQILQTATS